MMTASTGDRAGLPNEQDDALNIAAPFGVGADVAADQNEQERPDTPEDSGDDVLLPPLEDAGSRAEEHEQRRREE
jgi:hypothetical protein